MLKPLRRTTGAVRALAAGSAAVAVAFVVGRASAAPPRVIPWLDQRPVKASAHPPLAPACTAAALHAQLFLQGATGSLVGGVDLLNTSSTPCSLLGWPTVSFTGVAAASVQLQVTQIPRSPQPPDVLADPLGSLRALAPGKSASVYLRWGNWCGPLTAPTGSTRTPPDGLQLTFEGSSSLVLPLSQAPYCYAPKAPSVLEIAPFSPTASHLPESSRLPLRATIVGPRPVYVKPHLRALPAHRGQLLRYRVALTNTGSRPFRFATTSCPDYIEQIIPSPAQLYILNCSPAGTIAPGATVLFAMQLRVPENAPLRNTGLSLELAPRTYQAPFASAAVWITP